MLRRGSSNRRSRSSTASSVEVRRSNFVDDLLVGSGSGCKKLLNRKASSNASHRSSYQDSLKNERYPVRHSHVRIVKEDQERERKYLAGDNPKWTEV